jgi:predicted transglutaminase-like cysteine proteinase
MQRYAYTTLILLLLSSTIISACSCQKGAAVIEKVIFASGISNSNEPIGVTDTFFMDQDTIYCFVTVANVMKDTKVSTRWLLKEGEIEDEESIEIGRFEQTISTPTNISFGLELDQDQDILLPIGKYEIIISLDDQFVTSSYFFITMPPTPSTEILTGNNVYSNSDNKHASYSWSLKGIDFTLELDIPTKLYDSYASKTRITTSDPSVYSLYVSHPDDDEYLSRIAEAIKQMALNAGFSDEDYLKSIIRFVRSIRYSDDFKSTGFDEYPKYPIETLVDGTGDCEDSSILLASILQAAGIPSVLLLTNINVIPGHSAVGIAGEGTGDLISYEYDNKKYFYVEATNIDLAIGHVLDMYDPEDFFVMPIDPLPAITYTIDDFRAGRVYRIRAYVKNIGSMPIEGIELVSVIYSEDKEVVVSQKSEPFSLSVNQEAIVTFYLPYNQAGNYELNVYAEYGDSIGYTLEASFTGP